MSKSESDKESIRPHKEHRDWAFINNIDWHDINRMDFRLYNKQYERLIPKEEYA